MAFISAIVSYSSLTLSFSLFHHRYTLADQQFLSLSCKVTKEVVSLDLSDADRALMIAAGPGPHLTPQQFHDVITAAASEEDKQEGHQQDKKKEEEEEKGGKESNLVLIDVRNIYETEIGRFACPGIPVLDPKTRKVMKREDSKGQQRASIID